MLIAGQSADSSSARGHRRLEIWHLPTGACLEKAFRGWRATWSVGRYPPTTCASSRQLADCRAARPSTNAGAPPCKPRHPRSIRTAEAGMKGNVLDIKDEPKKAAPGLPCRRTRQRFPMMSDCRSKSRSRFRSRKSSRWKKNQKNRGPAMACPRPPRVQPRAPASGGPSGKFISEVNAPLPGVWSGAWVGLAGQGEDVFILEDEGAKGLVSVLPNMKPRSPALPCLRMASSLFPAMTGAGFVTGRSPRGNACMSSRPIAASSTPWPFLPAANSRSPAAATAVSACGNSPPASNASWRGRNGTKPSRPSSIPRGGKILAGGRDGSVSMWEAKTGTRLRRLPSRRTPRLLCAPQ